MKIRCRLHLLLASLGPGDEPRRPAWLGHHLERCPDCREALAAERELHACLRTSPPHTVRVPPGLKSRIMAGIDSEPRPLIAPWTALRWQTVGLATVTIAILFAVLQLSRPTPEPTVTESPTPSTERQLATAELPQLPLANEISRLLRDSETSNPLEKEVLLAMDDGRRAFAHAIHSVVPTAAAQTILDSAFEMLPRGSRLKAAQE